MLDKYTMLDFVTRKTNNEIPHNGLHRSRIDLRDPLEVIIVGVVAFGWLTALSMALPIRLGFDRLDSPRRQGEGGGPCNRQSAAGEPLGSFC